MAPVLIQSVKCRCQMGTFAHLGLLHSSSAQAAAVGITTPISFHQGVAKRLSSPVRLVSLPPQGLLNKFLSQRSLTRSRPFHPLSSSSQAGRFVRRKVGAIKVDSVSSSVSVTKRQSRRLSDDGKAQTEPPLGLPTGHSKTCQQCYRAKPSKDFKRTVGSQDGRLEFCRACMAVFHAERLKKELHHLGLSVEEAWESGKPCIKCGDFKELRDFVRSPVCRDGVQNICRGCQSDKLYELPHKVPMDAPQECVTCHEYKAASEFALNKASRTGLLSRCKACARKTKNEYVKKVKEAPKHMLKKTKRCSVCRESKPSTNFSPDQSLSDGLTPACKECRKEHARKWRLGRKLPGDKGVELDATHREVSPGAESDFDPRRDRVFIA